MAYLEPHVKLVNWSHSLRPLGTLNEFQLLGRERKIPQSRQNLGSVQVGDASIVVGEGVAGEGAFVLAGCGGVDIGFISGLRLAPIRFGRLATSTSILFFLSMLKCSLNRAYSRCFPLWR